MEARNNVDNDVLHRLLMFLLVLFLLLGSFRWGVVTGYANGYSARGAEISPCGDCKIPDEVLEVKPELVIIEERKIPDEVLEVKPESELVAIEEPFHISSVKLGMTLEQVLEILPASAEEKRHYESHYDINNNVVECRVFKDGEVFYMLFFTSDLLTRVDGS